MRSELVAMQAARSVTSWVMFELPFVGDKLMAGRTFMVGCGALGCEFLKVCLHYRRSAVAAAICASCEEPYDYFKLRSSCQGHRSWLGARLWWACTCLVYLLVTALLARHALGSTTMI